jgi:hypothetical protein
MKRVSLLSLVALLFTVSLSAQNVPAPVIESVQPAAGPIDGGTLVTITGRNLSLPDGFACILPCPAVVRFGDAEVTALDERQTYITVRTPAHAAGTVDVTVRTGDNRSVTKANAFTFVQTREQGYETLLLPIYTDGDTQGAHNSVWRTEFWIRNNSDQSVTLAPWECPINSACPAVFPLTHTLPAGASHRNLPAFFRPPTSNPGRLLFVTREFADSVSTSLRLWDVSRESADAGTEIPVVREEDFRTTATQLLSVPLSGRFRLTLRVYEIAHSEARFRVRVYEQREGAAPALPIDEFELTATTADQGPFRVQPAYAQRDRIERILELPNVFPPQVRIEVTPLTQGSLFWTFVAATNNETQRVTLITPQP